MSRREVPYVAKCPAASAEAMQRVIDNQVRLLLVATNGPTAFVIKDGDTAHRVLVGARQTCTCGAAASSSSSVFRDGALCVHIAFVMLKVLRVPPDNPVAWQLSLVDAELEAALASRFALRKPRVAPKKTTQRQIDPEEVCPVCLDPLATDLTSCGACGNWIHSRCLLDYAFHRDDVVACPLCREPWTSSALAALRRRRRRKKRRPHHRVSCAECEAPIVGDLARCAWCPIDLCRACASSHDASHPLVKKARPGDQWAVFSSSSSSSSASASGRTSLGDHLAAALPPSSPSSSRSRCVECLGPEANATYSSCGHATHRACAARAIDAGVFECPACAQSTAPGLHATPAAGTRPLARLRAATLRHADHQARVRAAEHTSARREEARRKRELAALTAVRRTRALVDQKTRDAHHRRLRQTDASSLGGGGGPFILAATRLLAPRPPLTSHPTAVSSSGSSSSSHLMY